MESNRRRDSTSPVPGHPLFSHKISPLSEPGVSGWVPQTDHGRGSCEEVNSITSERLVRYYLWSPLIRGWVPSGNDLSPVRPDTNEPKSKE